jgi:thiamine phosphate synthase YjbQ (UPF0047 family)
MQCTIKVPTSRYNILVDITKDVERIVSSSGLNCTSFKPNHCR